MNLISQLTLYVTMYDQTQRNVCKDMLHGGHDLAIVNVFFGHHVMIVMIMRSQYDTYALRSSHVECGVVTCRIS